KQQLYRMFGRPVLMSMIDLMRKQGTMEASAIFDDASFKRRYGFSNAKVHFFNHHLAHALPAYFFSGFDDALIYTADGIGDNISYSATVARRGAIDILEGGDSTLMQPY